MLQEQDWLPQAKRLSVGMKLRVTHGRERRPNMVLGNTSDRWWAYCQACKSGAVVLKEHVVLGLHEPAPPVDLSFPTDLVRVLGSEAETPVMRFLASKNMDSMYLPELWYSASRKRLLLDTGHGWMGRDITGNSPSKWLTYNRQKLLGTVKLGMIAIVVEDTFSWYKVRWALRNSQGYCVLCALGTGVHDALVLELLKARGVLWFFDADAAGRKGASSGCKRMRGVGVLSSEIFPPEGLDPKDMQCNAILNLIGQHHETHAH